MNDFERRALAALDRAPARTLTLAELAGSLGLSSQAARSVAMSLWRAGLAKGVGSRPLTLRAR